MKKKEGANAVAHMNVVKKRHMPDSCVRVEIKKKKKEERPRRRTQEDVGGERRKKTESNFCSTGHGL